MAIPASVLLYANWVNGTGTYTAATPDKPNAHSYTFNASASIATEAAAPWNGQSLAQLNSGTMNVTSTLSSATVQVTSGRFFYEATPIGAAGNGFNLHIFKIVAATSANGEFRVRRSSSGEIHVDGFWNGAQQVDANLGAESSNPYCVEVIYDTNNATAADRLKARTWDKSGSAGSFTTYGAGSAQSASDQFTTLNLGMSGTGTPNLKIGRIAISNDIAEDLSNLDEGAGASGPAIGARYIIGPWVR